MAGRFSLALQNTLSIDEIARLEAMSVCEKRLRREGFVRIAGVDEAGRGPLAGPVVAAACILPEGALFASLNDSKQLQAGQREMLFAQITAFPGIQYGIGKASVAEIDRYNILKATFLAMRRAVAELPVFPDYLLIDGNSFKSDLPYSYKTIIRGDDSCLSVACASIIAKVTRDRILNTYDQIFPQYGFKHHKGYPTREHKAAIKKFGLSLIHRRTFHFHR